jgi:hypothetical protein
MAAVFGAEGDAANGFRFYFLGPLRGNIAHDPDKRVLADVYFLIKGRFIEAQNVREQRGRGSFVLEDAGIDKTGIHGDGFGQHNAVAVKQAAALKSVGIGGRDLARGFALKIVA